MARERGSSSEPPKRRIRETVRAVKATLRGDVDVTGRTQAVAADLERQIALGRQQLEEDRRALIKSMDDAFDAASKGTYIKKKR